ncbi:MAG: hypothetical protein AAGJ84_02750 [Pseudomonadota bacterium]
MRAILLSSFILLSGCATVGGVGEDLGQLGRGISDIAEEVQADVQTEECDSAAGELAGGPDLPACPD